MGPIQKEFLTDQQERQKTIFDSRIALIVEYGVVQMVAYDIYAEYPSQVDVL